MKHYNQPETNVLQVMNNTIICASGGPSPAPGRSGSLGNMGQENGTW